MPWEPTHKMPLVHAAPSHAGMTPHKNAVVVTPDKAVAYPDHEEGFCDDAGPLN